MNTYEEKYKHALENFKKIKSANSDNKELVDFIEFEYPELRESEDENIRKELYGYFRDLQLNSDREFSPSISVDEILAWLEKQGEQKPIDESEPKFKIGDWITNGEYTWKVTDIKPLDYILQSQNGDTVDDTISYVDEEFHIWTIEDAKDGDVLAIKWILDNDIWEKILIFKALNDNGVEGYGNTFKNKDLFFTNEKVPYYSKTWSKYLCPATKEQRDLLFQKMKEAGYEWDSDKKEIRKTCQKPNYCHHEVDETGWTEEYRKAYYDGWNNCNQQHAQLEAQRKPTWSDEDEKISNAIYESIDFLCLKSFGFSEDEVCDWLKSLKDRVQPKQEWSEYDKIQLSEAIQMIEANGTWIRSEDAVKKVSNWLKSLKPNNWKPSEEQLKALKQCIGGYYSEEADKKLEALYDELKQL